MESIIDKAFPVESDAATAQMFEAQQRELDKYKTRYVFVPLFDALHPAIGYAPAGRIHPIPAPKGKVNVRLLPEGAQVLEVVSPSMGIPGPGRAADDDPKIEALLQKIEAMEQAASARGQEKANIAIYLHEVAPIISGILSVYGRSGAIEVATFAGMPPNAFETHRINEQFFSAEALEEGDIPGTARAFRKQMKRVLDLSGKQKTQAAGILARAANEILASVAQCERYCSEHVRSRHLEMDDPQNDAPKRYSAGDLRAIEFIGAVKRNEFLENMAEHQKQSMTALPQFMEAMERREQQWAQMFGEMSKVLSAQTKVLEGVAANQSKK